MRLVIGRLYALSPIESAKLVANNEVAQDPILPASISLLALRSLAGPAGPFDAVTRDAATRDAAGVGLTKPEVLSNQKTKLGLRRRTKNTQTTRTPPA